MQSVFCLYERPMHPTYALATGVLAFSARKAKRFENRDDFLFRFFKKMKRETTPQVQ